MTTIVNIVQSRIEFQFIENEKLLMAFIGKTTFDVNKTIINYWSCKTTT
jgi:hypothetical protein